MGGAEFRPRPIGLPNLARDGAGQRSGKGRLTLLPGKIPLGEPIIRRQTELAKPTIREEINAYLAERARLRAEGQLPQPEDEPPIITPADAISIDLHDLLFSVRKPQTDEQRAKRASIDRITWGFDALAFGKMSQPMQEHIAVGCEFAQGFLRNHPEILEKTGRLNGEEAGIVAEQLHKVGLPFEPLPAGITIPYAPTVQKMREIAGGEPLFLSLPPQNVTSINDHPRRDR